MVRSLIGGIAKVIRRRHLDRRRAIARAARCGRRTAAPQPATGSHTRPSFLLRERDRVRPGRRAAEQCVAAPAPSALPRSLPHPCARQRPLGDHRPDQARGGEGIDHHLVIDAARIGEPGEHGREHARTSSGRRRDDDAHGRIHFLHRERARDHFTERRTSEGTRRTRAHFGRVAAHQPGGGYDRTLRCDLALMTRATGNLADLSWAP